MTTQTFQLDLYLRHLAQIAGDLRSSVADLSDKPGRDQDLTILAQYYLYQGATVIEPELARAYREIGQSVLALLAGPSSLWPGGRS